MVFLKKLTSSVKGIFKKEKKKSARGKTVKKKRVKKKVTVKKQPKAKPKKSLKKKPQKKLKDKPKKPPQSKPSNDHLGKPIGKITHYFNKIKVVVVDLKKGGLVVGDTIQIEGSVQFKQKVASMQIECVDVKAAKKGSLIGLKIKKKAREGDLIYKV